MCWWSRKHRRGPTPKPRICECGRRKGSRGLRLATRRPRPGAFLRGPLPLANTMVAEHVTDDDRHATECSETRGRLARAELNAAVERKPWRQGVDGAEVDRGHSAADGSYLREPERLQVRVPPLRDRKAGGHGHEMLQKMWQAAACSDRADAVVDVDVTARRDVGAGQQRDGVIRVARSKALVRIGRGEINRWQHRQHRDPTGVRPQPQLCPDLNVTEAAGAN